MTREQKLEQAIKKLLACPAIADGSHGEPAWGCKETAEAEAFARAAISAPKAEAHPDDKAVDRFAEAMKIKLAQKRKEGRGGWWDDAYCNNPELSAMLREHVDKGDPLDVGNLAMMLHQRGERIAPAPKAEAVERACATEGCSNGANVHFVRGDIGSWYCHSCYTKVQALAAFPSKGEGE